MRYSYISWRFTSCSGNLSPSKFKRFFDRSIHSNEVRNLSSVKEIECIPFSSSINHFSECISLNSPVGMRLIWFALKYSCLKCVCEWNTRLGSSVRLLLVRSLNQLNIIRIIKNIYFVSRLLNIKPTYSLNVKFHPFKESSVNLILFPSR